MANHSCKRRALFPVRGGRSPAGWLPAWCVALGVTIAAAAAPAPRQAEPVESQRTTERIRALQREADALVNEEKALLAELRSLEAERQRKAAEAARADVELKETRKQLEATVARAAALSDTAAGERPEIEARLVRLYKLGRAGYWRLLLDVEDVQAMGRAYRTALTLTQADRARILRHQRTLEALAGERAALEARAREVAALQEKAAAARAALDRTVKAKTALVASIDARRDVNAQLAGELQAAEQKLQAANPPPSAGPAAPAGPLPIRPFRGTLPWPASGIVTARFGPSFDGRGAPRTGIDISIAEGQAVRAVHDGTVAFVDQLAGLGNVVIVDHGDTASSVYGYLTSFGVKRGDHVDAQTAVGVSGRNPSGNPALYFELRIDGRAVDPLQWLKKL